MKFFFLLALLSTSVLAAKKPVYQVMSSHPHDVAEFSSFVTTVKQEGRLWLVEKKDNAPESINEFLLSVEGRDLRSYIPQVTLLKMSPDSELIKTYTSQINVAEIRKSVETLSAYKTRLAGSSDNRKATDAIKAEFASMGLSVSKVCYKADTCSVIADKVGTEKPSEVILVMAHLDSVGKDFAGADDNGSGVAVMMEIARVLQTYPNKKTIRFFATNGEEGGLFGAEHYANLLAANGQIKNMVLAINMDMVGYNSNGIVELETDSQYEGLAKWFAQLTATYTTLTSKITLGAWGSDHVPFIQKNVPTLLTIEDWSTKTPCYHTACDKPDSLNYVYAGEIGKLNTAATITKDLE
jgi:Zn-dependent M28 family amino/carboxypeptidase